ncbi:MAG TPA: FixH family protein [Gammaproteobacteria bacterium]
MNMNALRTHGRYFWQRRALAAAVLSAVFVCAARDVQAAGRHDIQPPAKSEFGLGPRASVGGHYTAVLQPSQPLRPRQLQTVLVVVTDSEGHTLDGATIAIDGGMPQHGHGLPTRPRVTRNLGAGQYEIAGVRFNMGGWWELSLDITSSGGSDRVTFNLAL